MPERLKVCSDAPIVGPLEIYRVYSWGCPMGYWDTTHVLVRLKFVTVKVACGTYFTPFLRCSLGFPCTDKPSVKHVECHVALFVVSDDKLVG